MARGPGRQWKARKPPFTHEHVQLSVAEGLVDEERGFYAEKLYEGCETQERAEEIRRSLHRCAQHMGFSIRARVEKAADGTWQVRYHAIDKAKARAWVLATYGPDRSKWPYNPYYREPRPDQEVQS